METVQLGIQEPIVVMDFIDVIPDSSNYVHGDVPVVGMVKVYGMVISTRALTVKISQGVSQHTGALVYDFTDTTVLVPNVAQRIEANVCGKYLRVELSNASGFAANVKAFFLVRAYT